MNSNNIENINTEPNPYKGWNKKNTKKWLLILTIVIISLIAITTCVFILAKNKNTKNKNKNIDEIQTLHSFFIKNKNKEYALYNAKGKQLSEFGFQKVGKFYNQATVVQKDNKYAIINEDGNIVVGYDVYGSIEQKGFMFTGTKSDGTREILDYKGKVWSGCTAVNSANEEIAVLLKGDNVEIINAELKNIATLPQKAESSYAAYATIQVKENYAVVNLYEGKNEIGYLIDINNKDKYLKLDKGYSIEGIDTKQNAIVLAHGANGYRKIDEIIVIKDFNILYKCDEEFLTSFMSSTKYVNAKFMDNYVYIENIKTLISLSNGNVSDFSKYTSVSFITPDTYVGVSDKKIEFFVNSKLVNTLNEDLGSYSLSSLNNGYYRKVSKYSTFNQYIYKKDGTLLNDKKYKTISEMINKYIILQENDKYYIVDQNFNKVTDECYNITHELASLGTYQGENQYEDYFAVYTDSKNTLKLLDSNMKTVFEYTSPDNKIAYLNLNKHNGQLYVTIKFSSSKVKVYNANTNKLVSDIGSKWTNNKDYYTVETADKETYYSYIGDKEFYSE